MSFAAGLTLLVVLVALVAMMREVASPDIVLLTAVLALMLGGVLGPADALAGFANPGMLTIAALFVVAAGLRETGAVNLVILRLLGRPTTLRKALLRLLLPVTVGSAFLNNTTIVATLLPAVHDWSRRLGVAPSRLLLPLSYAAILGGLGTLVGTSTNLVVAGLVEELLPTRPDLHSVGMFEMTPLGALVALAGGGVLVLFGPWLLPDRRPPINAQDDIREYTVELIVPKGSHLANGTVEDVGLRHVPGIYLMEVLREGEVNGIVDGTFRLAEEDRLVFVGDVDAVVDLLRLPGLAAAPQHVFKLSSDPGARRMVEAVVSSRNPLVGQSIREGGFRRRYGAVVVAVARAGERLGGRIGDIVLHAGDVLLLEALPAFAAEQRVRSDFVLVSSLEGASLPRTERIPHAALIMVGLMLAVTLELVPTVTAALLAAGATVATRCCTVEEARRSLDLTVLVAIASAFGLGRAMQVSGLDQVIAQGAVSVGATSPWLALLAIYLVTAVLTELVTNNAAAVLTLPIGIELADAVGADPMPFVFTVMFAASAAFNTPIGYQTNLMVYNAGGYRPSDYPRVGLPVSFAVAAVVLVGVPYLWPF